MRSLLTKLKALFSPGSRTPTSTPSATGSPPARQTTSGAPSPARKPDAYDTALRFLIGDGDTLGVEGGFSDRKWDRGGRTMRGVTQRAYDTWRRSHERPIQDVRRITADELRRFYREGYWLGSNAHRLPWPVSLVQFDTAVNSGPGRATKLLQVTLGVRADGKLGPITRAAVRARDPRTLALDYIEHRRQYNRRLAELDPSAYGPALTGWMNRLDKLRTEVFRNVD